jgi:hypothetical protein
MAGDVLPDALIPGMRDRLLWPWFRANEDRVTGDYPPGEMQAVAAQSIRHGLVLAEACADERGQVNH